ncbi:uncharacterized protein LOC111874314 [Cryptotermes secundus]|uniref:uncharacterized protein LOC111874314 n=1 Tax=Cryptotermes secundus TaxID=105785 RepID=UPI000CD7CCE3|nr:uncharacterized protein LOC111874314 [Cryptotermes secundus]
MFKSGRKTGDYHHEMNSGNFEKWILEKLIPNLPPRTVIVTDNASYHNIEVTRGPTSNNKVSEMKQWLAERNILYPASALKPDLYEIIKKHKSDNKEYRLDAICAAAGHSVIRLPPYHPDFNPTEMVWGTVKNWMGQRNVTFKLDDAMRLAEEKFNSISAEYWAAYCNKVENREDQSFARELDIDTRIDNIIITSDSEESETSDEDDE